MKLTRHELLFAGAVICFGACTYNEYHNTYNQVVEPDAGTPVSQAGRGGSGGSGGGSGGSGGSSGSDPGGSAGGGSEVSCTGCTRLTMPATPARAVGLAFDDDQNLSSTQLSWRLRVRGEFNGSVNVTLYAESGSGDDERLNLGSFSLTAADGWQTFGADFASVEPFRAPGFIDAGEGAAGGGFDSGFPFDKSAVERIVVLFATQATGIFTPLVVEIDSIQFSNHTELDRNFATSGGELELISLFDTATEGATLVHVAE